MSKNRILYTEVKDMIIIRIEGKGSWVESKPFLDFAETQLKKGKKIVVDLSDCELLDSTFLGTLAYLSLNYSGIEISSPGKEVKRAITTLGLTKILRETKIKIPEEKGKELEKHKLSPEERAKILMKAHRTLISIEPANLPQFKDLLELVEKENEKE
ncbi:STAS domain-containing protein [Candidatus Calescamantes bacterium]|nr:STAS domain-containing protein [Candidatus Calescamantes bacterium]